jgi:hypothetical protein
MTPMRPTTLRFPESLWRMIEEDAEQEGISASEFTRCAVLAAVLIRRARRNPELGLNWERALTEARELLSEADDSAD